MVSGVGRRRRQFEPIGPADAVPPPLVTRFGGTAHLTVALGVFLVDSHLAAVQAPAPAAPATAGRDDGGVGRAVGAKAGVLLDHAAPVLAPAGTAARPAGLVVRHN